ncbi:hypothetical protein SteCoe_28782 [Stentor coeruleus]|uniref:Cyclic nucleotide-binding domain-containing protein n=1 Tax=Stentor coeruleus TaxID=5963 RepID=A0A1R2B7T0_9CILI|nr:hypothetical protein SteCoe_28782 [Stentor coeruleus]
MKKRLKQPIKLNLQKHPLLVLNNDSTKSIRTKKIYSPQNSVNTSSCRSIPNLPKIESDQEFSDVFPQWLLSRQDFQDSLSVHSSDLNPATICRKPHYQRDSLEVRALKAWTKECLFFQHLTERTANEVRKKLRTININKGDTIFKQNDPGDCLYLVAKGLVEVYKNGIEFIDIIGPKNTIGEGALENNCLRNATLIAKTPVSLLVLKNDDYNDIVRRQKHKERFDMIEYLKSIPLFCTFYGSKLERIAWNLFPMQYKKNQIIYSINDEPMNFYIIRQGSIKMEKTVSLKLKSRMPCGYKSEKFFIRERTYLKVLRECFNGDFFGEEEIVKGIIRSCKVVCTSDDTILWLLNKDLFLSVFSEKDIENMAGMHAERPTSKVLKNKLRSDFMGHMNRFKAILDATNPSPLNIGREEPNKKDNLIRSFRNQHVNMINNQLLEEKILIEQSIL